MKRVVILLSGGLDSTTLLYFARHRGYLPTALSVNYGQRHARELEAAQAICAQIGVDWHEVDLSSLKPLLRGSALTDSTVEVPEGHYAAPSMAATVVPNRNAILLSIAWGLAVAQNAAAVGYAAHSGDHPIYPDCRPVFTEALGRALSIGNEGFGDPHLELWTPFIHFDKTDVVRLGQGLGVPFAQTWSCYQGGSRHCGRCGTCVERQEAFELAGVPDPTSYMGGR